MCRPGEEGCRGARLRLQQQQQQQRRRDDLGRLARTARPDYVSIAFRNRSIVRQFRSIQLVRPVLDGLKIAGQDSACICKVQVSDLSFFFSLDPGSRILMLE
ncbi:hypothetical protein AXG93_2817s1370 [Marchantia polymorpha subsp. ruderalis]|uniref:Uncharacterized protein n=1 Tax=Marchantia polymorpha subsp. ruderalis TaxID=1480154 RepID=A0A176W464_MARPO|nr:hypothetical protein AXG93_2817s1370 [Marchantia polymorpha subsp. ruderalis]